jgi:hypothetical protein
MAWQRNGARAEQIFRKILPTESFLGREGGREEVEEEGNHQFRFNW